MRLKPLHLTALLFFVLSTALAGAKDKVVLLPIKVKLQGSAEELDLQGLFARAGLLEAIKERGFDVVSPVQVEAVSEQLGVDYTDQAKWSRDDLDKLAERFKAKYVIGIELADLKVWDEQVTSNGRVAPGLMTNAEATALAWVFDTSSDKFLLEKKEAKKKEQQGKPMPDDTEPRMLKLKAVQGAAVSAVEEFLKKFRKIKVKPPQNVQ